MYQISSLTVTQIRIFKVDELPFSSLQMPSSAALIRVAFNFQQVALLAPPQVPDPQGAFQFSQGEFSDGGITFAIPQLQIEPRRVTLIVASTSEIANKAFEYLKGVMLKADPRAEKPVYEPIFTTEETVSIVKYDFSIDRLFESGPLHDFAKGLQDKVSGYGGQTSLTPSAVKYQVLYGELSENLRAQGVIHLPKEIRIELRNQTKPEDCHYFVQSPNPSSKHLELLEYIESNFGNK